MKMPALLLLVVGLASCASIDRPLASGIEKGSVVAPDGLVVISSWAPGKSISFASYFTIDHLPEGKVMAELPIDSYVLKPQFTDGWGYLRAFSLPAGDYVLTLHQRNGFMRYLEPEAPLEFSVRGGEFVYLGEANFARRNGDGFVVMRDQSDRDLAMFVAKNPSFSPADFQKRLAAHR